MREHDSPEKECLQRIHDIAVGYDGEASRDCEQGSVKGLCKLVDEMRVIATKGLRGEWPEQECSQVGSRVVWMIEKNGEIASWWNGTWDTPESFTENPNAAVMFPSHESAAFVFNLLLNSDRAHNADKERSRNGISLFAGLTIAEHKWI